MKYALGEKVNMTQIFDEAGNAIPVTQIKLSPSVVTLVRTKEKDGYSAVQLGFGEKSAKRVSKPETGHLKELGVFKVLREFRVEGDMPSRGDKIGVEVFNPGDDVEVSGNTKAKGFQGVVKRHGFKGGPRSHGQKHSEREPGSIGGGGRDGGRVAKGMRMAGRMGGVRRTVTSLKVVAVDPETQSLYISGAIPGRRGTIVEIKSK